MNEQEYIAILWRFVLGTLAALLAIGGFMLRWISTKLDNAATRAEVEKLEVDFKTDRKNRDDHVDKKLEEISTAVTGTHRRVDELYKHLIERSPR